MPKYLVILVFVLCLTACGVSSSAPLDDAYFWPDDKAAAQTDNIEVLNENDNSVTIHVTK